MLEQREIIKLKLKIKDTYNLNDLVSALAEWLEENHYVDLEGLKDYESLYTHAVRQGGAFLDAWLWWRALKYPEGTTKDTSLVRYRVHVDMHFLGSSSEVEMMAKGKKVKMNKGDISITITAFLEIDFRNEWKDKGISNLIHTVFKKRLYKKELDDHVGFLLGDAYKLQNMFKQFFKLESTAPEETITPYPKGLAQ